MYSGSRVTDAVEFYRLRQDWRGAVSAVRRRDPEWYRWRNAVFGVTAEARVLDERNRQQVEEPIHEMVLHLTDLPLQSEVVLDARRNGVDLDRGLVLPHRTVWDVERLADVSGLALAGFEQHLKLPTDRQAPVDTAAVALRSRALAKVFRRRAHQVLLEVPEVELEAPSLIYHRYLVDKAARDVARAERWESLAQTLIYREPDSHS